jgi:preprotein translocase subunit SecG
MGIIGVIVLVLFVIVCVLLVSIVLIQSEEGGGMGGLFGGAGTQAFGSRSGNIITRATYVLVALFFVSVFGLAFLHKEPVMAPLDQGIEQPDAQRQPWLDTPAQLLPLDEIPAPAEQGGAQELPPENTGTP